MGKRAQSSIDNMISQLFLSLPKCIDVYSISTFGSPYFLQIQQEISAIQDHLRLIGGIKGFRTVKKPVLYSNCVSLIEMTKIEY